MKTFIASLITFTVLIICVTLNCIFVQSAVDDLSSTADRLSDDGTAIVLRELTDKWKQCKDWIALSVSHAVIDEIDDTIALLEVHIDEKNQSAFSSTVASLKCQLSRLAESETLSPGRIL